MLGVAAVAAVALVACGGDDDDGGGAANPTAAASPTAAGQVAKLQIIDPRARDTTNDVTAAYFTVKNTGDAADRLISVTADVSTKVEVHETVSEGGTVKMQPVKAPLEIPAGGELVLKPGGYHVMIMNLASPLAVGQQVKLTLTFEKSGKIEVVAPVKKIEAMGGMN